MRRITAGSSIVASTIIPPTAARIGQNIGLERYRCAFGVDGGERSLDGFKQLIDAALKH